MMEECGFDLLGCDDLVGEAAVTIPTVGANYTDAKTVTAVQYALVKKGYNLGTSGPNNDGVDGLFGPKTSAAIKKVQATVGAEVNGRIDETVIMALKVTPGVLPPGVTAAGRAAVQAQVALDAATLAEHATTPAEVQQAAQEAVTASTDAQPPLPPEVRQAAMAALTKAKAATTPAQVQQVKQEVQAAAQDAHAAVKPSWWTSPAWAGGWKGWQLVTVIGGVTVAAGAAILALTTGGVSTMVASAAAVGLGSEASK